MAKTKDPDSSAAVDPAGKAATSKAPPKGPVPVHIGGDSIVDRVLPHIKKIAVGLGVIALILSAFFGYRWWKDRGRGKATSYLAKALDVRQRDVVKPDPDVTPDPTKPPEPGFASHKERALAVLAELDRGASGVVTNLYRGSLLLDAGKLDEAEAAFRRSSSGQDLDAVLAREGLGFVAEARAQAATDPAAQKQQLEAALAAFRAVQVDDKGPHRDHALYHEARILAWMQKKPEAVAALEKALEVDPDTDLASVINDRLAQLEAP